MSSAEQQSISGIRRRRPQSLSRRGSRDGRRHRQRRRRKRMSRTSRRIGSRPSSSTARPRCSRRPRSSTKRNGPPRPPINEWSTARTSPSSPAPRRPPASTRQTDGRRGRARRPRRRRRAVDGLRPNGGTAMGTWLAHVRAIVGHIRGAHPRHPAHRRQGRARDPRTTRRGNRAQRRRIHLRLPGSGHRLAASRSCARSHRHCWAPSTSSPTRRPRRRLRGDDAHLDGQVDPRSDAAPVDPGRCARRVRQAGRADRRGPDPPPGRRGKPVRRIPAGRLGRRGPRLPHPGRGRAGGGRTREAGRACDGRRRRPDPRRGAGEGDVDHRYGPVGPDQSPGRALHRPGGAGAGGPGGIGRTQERRHRHRDRETTARHGTRRGIRQRRNSQAAAAKSSRSTSTPAPPGCDATSPPPTRWRSTPDRPGPHAYGRRPDAHLRRRPCVGGRRLLRRVRITDRKPCRTTRSPPPIEAKACPACGAPVDGRFCEACGHDSALPEPARPAPAAAAASVEWTAVVTADQDYYKRVIARGGPDTVEFPEFFPERRITLQGSTTDRPAQPRQGVEPGIDLGIQPIDRGVSTQHAVLRIRDSGLTITDLGSTNGTSLNDSDDLLRKARNATVRRRPHPCRRVDHDHDRAGLNVVLPAVRFPAAT